MTSRPSNQGLLLSGLLLVGLGVLSLAEGQASAQESGPLFRSDVETILVNVLVTDQNGQPISALEQGIFHLFEDGVEQEILNFFPVDAPFSVALMLDTSYSTVGKLGRIQNAAIGFLHQIHPDDEVMVISFDDQVYLDTDFTRNHDEVERAIKSTRSGGSTQLYDAVYIGLERLQEQSFRKIMVLFTDGVDSTSMETSEGETINFSKEADATLYTIFFDTETDALAGAGRPLSVPGPAGTPGTIPGRNPGPLGIPTPSPFPMPMPAPPSQRRQPEEIGREDSEREQINAAYREAKYYLGELAETTGGASFSAALNLTDLDAAFARIAEEMRNLYSIAYVSNNPQKDGKFREIKVTVDRPEGRVRARRGYYSRD
jgi:VWFA-related protein